MTVRDVFELRKLGRIEEAYDVIRPLYANDKGPYTSLAMFWTTTDILKKRLNEERIDEAEKIFAALERMLPNVPDKEGVVERTFKKCRELLERGKNVTDWQKTVLHICRRTYGTKNWLPHICVRKVMSSWNATGIPVIGILILLHKKTVLLCLLK